jgi:hypothetical protein
MTKSQRRLALLLTSLLCRPVFAQPAAGTRAADLAAIREFETRYLQTVDDGDVAAQLVLVSRRPEVHSILDGEIWRGWDAIHSQAEQYVPISKLVKNAVDGLEIVPLGHDAAIVVVRLHAVKVDPTDQTFPDDMAGVLTHVLERTPEGWRMMLEHYSTVETPEFLEWRLALARQQRAVQATGRESKP